MSSQDKDHPGTPTQGLTEKQELDLANRLRLTCWCLGILMVAGLVVIVFQSGWHFRAAAFLWALACLSLGWVGGFLFAVPRVPRTSATGTDPSAAPVASSEIGSLGINTNLTEISDWLTKILVGLGLVELRSIPQYMWRVGRYVGHSLGSDGNPALRNGMDSAASGIVLYFLGLGFLSGYLLTRMFFSPAFWLADRATTIGTSDGIAQAISAAFSAVSTATTAANAASSAVSAAQDATQVATGAKDESELNSLLSTAMEELTRKPLQQSRIRRLVTQLTDFQPRFPLNRKLAIVLGRLLGRGEGDLNAGIGVLQAFVDQKRKSGENDIDVSDALFNIGCYYSLQMKGAEGQALTEFGEKALTALRECVQISPENGADFLTDPDFATLRESHHFGPRARALVEEATTQGKRSPTMKSGQLNQGN